MSLFKKIACTLFSAFLAYQVYFLLIAIINMQPQATSKMVQFILAFLLTLFITGVFAFVGFVYPTHKVLPANYYKIKHPDRLRKIYNGAQVAIFRKALLLFFWGTQKNRKKFFDGSRQGIKNFIHQTKQSEFGHLAAFVVILIACVVLLFFQFYILVFFATLINVIGNVYPVILQRYHRIRIGRIFE